VDYAYTEPWGVGATIPVRIGGNNAEFLGLLPPVDSYAAVQPIKSYETFRWFGEVVNLLLQTADPAITPSAGITDEDFRVFAINGITNVLLNPDGTIKEFPQTIGMLTLAQTLRAIWQKWGLWLYIDASKTARFYKEPTQGAGTINVAAHPANRRRLGRADDYTARFTRGTGAGTDFRFNDLRIDFYLQPNDQEISVGDTVFAHDLADIMGNPQNYSDTNTKQFVLVETTQRTPPETGYIVRTRPCPIFGGELINGFFSWAYLALNVWQNTVHIRDQYMRIFGNTYTDAQIGHIHELEPINYPCPTAADLPTLQKMNAFGWNMAVKTARLSPNGLPAQVVLMSDQEWP
jgi:hypothetical protein